MLITGRLYVSTRKYFWDNVTLTGVTQSDSINLDGYRNKIITFISSVGDTLTIETDPLGDNKWGTYDTVVVVADTRIDYNFPDGMQHKLIRLSFPVAAAVTGSISMF